MNVLPWYMCKGKTISWDKFFHIEKDNFIILQIVPDTSVTNGRNVETLINGFYSMYKSIFQRIYLKNKKITYKTKDYCAYEILYTKDNISFNIAVPSMWQDFIIQKVNATWDKAAIFKIPDYLNSFNKEKTLRIDMKQKNYYFMSLRCDYRENVPLASLLSASSVLKKDDKLLFQLIMDPLEPHWKEKAIEMWEKYRKGKIDEKSESLISAMFDNVFKILDRFFEFTDMLLGVEIKEEKSKKKPKLYQIQHQLSSFTNQKINYEGFNTHIKIYSQSNDNIRREQNAKSIVSALKDIAGDNILIPSKARMPKSISRKIPIISLQKNILSTRELAQIVQMPTKLLQNEYKDKLKSIDTREINIPKELLSGIINIGTATKQGKKYYVKWSKDKNIASLPILISGSQNAGKTTYLKRYIKESYEAGYSNIYFDYIEDCQNSNAISKFIPINDKIIIRLGNKDNVPAMAFNEISRQITENLDPWKRVKYANMLSEQVEYLINSVTDKNTGELTASMLRYLHAASMITFIKPRAKVNDVFEVLRKWKVRNEYIRYAKYSGCFDDDDEIFCDLEELHARDSNGKIVGTRENLIIGIINRIIQLKKNPYLKAMLKADINDSFDFKKLIEEGKSIFIQIPQTEFPNPKTKDIICTFFISRIWLVVQLRKNNKNARLCKIHFDEVHQVPTCARFIKNHITEFRRHRLGLVTTCHYFKQFGDLFDAIKSAGCSYMLLAGTEKENIKMLEEEIKPFTLEEALKLKKWHSLNVINYGNEYTRFISKLPKPL